MTGRETQCSFMLLKSSSMQDLSSGTCSQKESEQRPRSRDKVHISAIEIEAVSKLCACLVDKFKHHEILMSE